MLTQRKAGFRIAMFLQTPLAKQFQLNTFLLRAVVEVVLILAVGAVLVALENHQQI
jgi:hypothetical protein